VLGDKVGISNHVLLSVAIVFIHKFIYMDYLQILFTMMVTVFLSYIIPIISIYGILPSVSESYYELPDKYNFLFTLFCWGFAIPTMIIGVDLTDNFLMFFAGAGICFVGAAAAFKEELPKKVHETSAIIGIVSSQLSIAFDFKMYYVNIIFAVLFALIMFLKLKYKIETHIFWIEMVAFTSISYVLGVNIF